MHGDSQGEVTVGGMVSQTTPCSRLMGPVFMPTLWEDLVSCVLGLCFGNGDETPLELQEELGEDLKKF